MEHGGRVLSIQSHTVHGYVGNKAAVFPMQLLGFDVDPINSVQFCNHTGYPTVKGSVLQGEQLRELIDGLEANNLLHYTHVLTGYIGSESFLRTILDTLRRVKQQNPDVKYVCDPVLGDNHKLYVPEQLIDIYKTELLAHAHTLTPNWFEAQLLTGIEIKQHLDAVRTAIRLYEMGPKLVVITSYQLPDLPEALTLLAMKVPDSLPEGCLRGGLEFVRIRMPRVPGYYTGTGDFVAACILAWTHILPDDLPQGLLRAVSAMQAVLQRTGYEPGVPRELRLIASRDDIINPRVTLTAESPLDLKNVKAIIWDLDGTLTLPHQIDFAGIRAELRIEAGVDIIRHVRGLEGEEQVVAWKLVEEFEARGRVDCKLQEDAAEVLSALRSSSRIKKMAVVTRNNAAAVDHFLELAGLPQEVFDNILTRDHEFCKPDPSAARHLAEHWGLHPSEVLFVGDHLDDMACGFHAGNITCLITSEEHWRDVVLGSYSDLVHYSVTDLTALRRLLLSDS